MNNKKAKLKIWEIFESPDGKEIFLDPKKALELETIIDELANNNESIDLVSKSFTEQQMDDAYDKGYSDCLKNKAC